VTAPARAQLGSDGEQLVALHLEREGFAIVARNVRVGRLEIDLIARRGDLLVFCEVRARASRDFLDPIETIDAKKQARIRRAAEAWLRGQREQPFEVRFDAASVLINADERTYTYYEVAF
jgi:putative endonuclease